MSSTVALKVRFYDRYVEISFNAPSPEKVKSIDSSKFVKLLVWIYLGRPEARYTTGGAGMGLQDGLR